MAHVIPVSEEFRRTISGSHTMAAKAELRTPEGEFIQDLDIDRGTVTIDETNAIRRRMNIKVVDETGELVPSNKTGLLNPLTGNQIWAYRGVVLPSTGEPEYVRLGKFNPSKFAVGDGRESFDIELTCYDLSRRVRRARFINNYTVALGTPFIDAIRDVIQFRAPWVTFDFSEVEEHHLIPTLLTPTLTFGGSGDTGGGNAWDAAIKMAELIGCEILFDADGNCVLRLVPEIGSEQPLWNYHEGDDAQFMFLNRSIDDEDTYNVVVVRGENPDNDEPITVVVKDEDPDSPTWVEGPYGEVPTFFHERGITSEEQGQLYGQAKLARRTAVTESVRITSLVNPAIQAGNAISIKRERSGVDDTFIVQRLPIGLTYEQPLQIGLRGRRG